MEYKDYYAVLGVSRDATQDDIKRAYRKLARKYHPDVSEEADADDKFKALGEAYEVLKDPEKRAAYDQLGADWKAGQDFRPPPDWDDGFEFRGGGPAGGAADFSDFFEELFGRGFASSGAGRRPSGRTGFRADGEDHHAKIHIDLEDSLNGARRAITLRVPELTDDGHVVTRQRTLNVKIPKGVRPGQQIRLAGQGGPAFGEGRAGDLLLDIEFNEHPRYRVDGADLIATLSVAPWEAALGATVTVATPTGDIDLKIPPDSRPGRRLRIKGRGLPGKTPGDFYVVLEVVLPPADAPNARDLYERMRDEIDFDPRATTTRRRTSA